MEVKSRKYFTGFDEKIFSQNGIQLIDNQDRMYSLGVQIKVIQGTVVFFCGKGNEKVCLHFIGYEPTKIGSYSSQHHRFVQS
jgi:hypothetical protein